MDVTTSSIQTLSFFHEAFQTFHINRTTIESLILSSQIPRNLRKKIYIYNQEEVYRKFLSNVSSKGKKLTKQIPPKKEKIFENSYSHSFDEIRKIENK